VPADLAVRFVCFVRRRRAGAPAEYAPRDFDVDEIQTWDQAVALWGGGEYQAIAKDAQHQVIRHFPGRRKWMRFAGEPKPMVAPPRPERPVEVHDPRAPILPTAALATPTATAVSAPATRTPSGEPDPADLLRGGLTRLGYRPAEANRAIAALGERVNVEPLADLIRAALAGLGPQPVRSSARAAQAPETAAMPPIAMNTEGNAVVLGGHTIPLHPFRGEMVMVAGDLDAPLDYEAGVIAQQLTSVWSNEVHEGEHFLVLRGNDLREFKANAARTRTNLVRANVNHLTILTQAGQDRVLLLTRKPRGVLLRDYLQDKVLPNLRRGEPVLPVSSSTPEAEAGPADVPRHPVAVEQRLDTIERALVALAALEPPPARPARPQRAPVAARPTGRPALPPAPAAAERHVTTALRLLGSSLDPRIRLALLGSTPPARPTVEHYLQLAAMLTEAISVMPGVLHASAPAERLEGATMFLKATEQLLMDFVGKGPDARVAPQDVTSLNMALSSAMSLCEALSGLPEDDPLREKLDEALERWQRASASYKRLLSRALAPPVPGAPPAPPASSGNGAVSPPAATESPRRRGPRLGHRPVPRAPRSPLTPRAHAQATRRSPVGP
jgi:hypothetical protein